VSSIILCPRCKRKLKVPESVLGKATRCPACKALIPPEDEPLTEVGDRESDAPMSHTPSSRVQKDKPPRTVAGTVRARPRHEAEPEDDIDLEEEEEVVRKRPARRGKSSRKGSSTGLIIGLVVGGVVLLLVVAGTGVGLLIYFMRPKSTIPEAEWKSFSPSGGDCTVRMPGQPAFQPLMTAGGMVNKYLIERGTDKTLFAVAFINLAVDKVPANILEVMTDAERAELTKRMMGTNAGDSAITLAQVPGREFQITAADGGTLVERIYLAKIGGAHRVYIVAAGYNSKNNKADADKFLASFKIDVPAAPPTYGAAAAGGPLQPGFGPPPMNPQPNLPKGNPQPRLPFGPPRRR
jgi:hypothetical protein